MEKYNYLLYGLGVSNKSIKEYFDLHHINYQVYCDDENNNINLEIVDIVVKSSGIKNDSLFLKKLKELNKLIISDLELFNYFYPNTFKIVVTGTNGKTSTVKYIALLLSKKYTCYLLGNIGIPLFSATKLENNKSNIVIIEASSFMLEYTYTLKPDIYVILNITPHHLDHHLSFNNYYIAKTKIINNMESNSLIVKNKDIFIKSKANILNIEDDIYKLFIKDNIIYESQNILYQNKSILNMNHQLKNIKTAIIIARTLGIKYNIIKEDLKLIEYAKYRLEIIDNKHIIINDSKSTNIYASLAGIKACYNFIDKLTIIIGGYGNINLEPMIDYFNKVKQILIFGSNRDYLLKQLSNFNNVKSYEDLDSLIKDNSSLSYVLFSPGAQSYDQYHDYIQRGNHFNELINKYWHY